MMQRVKIPYEVTAGGVLITRCKMRGVLVGGFYCINCPSFEGKNRNEHIVVCCNRTLQERKRKNKQNNL